MKPSAEHDIDVLNDLIEVTLDSADGYREAAKDAGSTSYRETFTRRAHDRQQIAQRLQEQVRALGGVAEDDGSVLAAAHRVFLAIRDRMSEGDEAVIQEVERGEDFILEKFDDALADVALSAVVADAIRIAYGSIRSGHDEASALKKMAASGDNRRSAM
jgi:uncharacterized protein (TIGR02284 family)